MGCWLCGWAVGEVVVPMQFLAGKIKDTGGQIFTLAWLGAWTVGGCLAIYAWLWNIAGKEMIAINAQILSIRRNLFGLGRTQEYEMRNVQSLRVAHQSLNPADFRYALQFWGVGGGSISFDYGAKTYRFGNALDEAEAKMLVEEINQRFKI